MSFTDQIRPGPAGGELPVRRSAAGSVVGAPVRVLRGHAVEVVVAVVALSARLGVILRHGGIHGIIGYDCGVYFAGADALIHGRVPYRDFTMVHPPGITLVLTPFAYLTHWMTDWHAFIIATLGFCLLGAVNAVLVVTVCRRLELPPLACALGGLFYAAWYGSVSGEFEVKLEPLGNVFLLCGLLLLLRAQRSRGGRHWQADVLAGAVLGLALTVKIWWGVPVVLLLVWHGVRRRRASSALRGAAGALIPVLLVYAPFFLLDPSGMFASVVTDQLGRERSISAASRISSLTNLPDLHDSFPYAIKMLVAAGFAVLLAVVAILAWRASAVARGLVVLLGVQLVVLFMAPSWYPYYADYIAVPTAVVVAAAAACASSAPTAARLRIRQLLAVPSALLVAAVLLITVTITATGSMAVRSFPAATALTRAVRGFHCVTTVNTTVLLRLDTLTRDLERGCPEWIDVTGHRYTLPQENRPQSRAAWERELIAYLRSGNATLTAHAAVAPAVIRALRKGGVITRAGGYPIYYGQR